MKRLVMVLAVVVTVAGCKQFECGTLPRANANPLKVGVYVGPGARANGLCYWQMLTTLSPDIEPKFLDENLIAKGGLAGMDVLVMPGGSSFLEYDTIKKAGADEKIKDFIRAGGGYVGTCAGNCIVLNEDRRLRLTPYAREASSGRHGTALLGLKFNENAKELCGIAPKLRYVRYSGGPIMKPADPVEGASFKTIATYDCDLVCSYGTNRNPIATMKDAPAAICGTYGKGRMFAIATHPEYRADTLDILEAAFRYVSGRKQVRLVRRQRRPGDLCVAVYSPGTEGVADANLIAALVTTPGLDVSFVNQKEEIGVGYLDHADVLVLPAGSQTLYKQKMSPDTAAFFKRFAAKGGKVFATGVGATVAPKGAVICASREELFKRVKAER